MAMAYYERAGDADRLLYVGGADELPVHASRWELVLPDAYGTARPWKHSATSSSFSFRSDARRRRSTSSAAWVPCRGRR
jgi:hypothetical protein